MARPPVNPDKTLAGIAVDPYTLERVIPESRRPDGSVRKQIKIRPGFTPQEDVRRFRGTRQAQMDAMALPKGHIVGWVPPSNAGSSSKSGSSSGNAFPALSKATNSNVSGGEKPLSKAAKKNAKRKEKREEKKLAEAVTTKDSWEDEDEDGAETTNSQTNAPSQVDSSSASALTRSTESDAAVLESKLENLQIQAS